MSHSVVTTLGYEFEPTLSGGFITMMGLMNTNFQVTIDGICLPDLSHHRTFTATFEIAPKESSNFGYGVIMAIHLTRPRQLLGETTSKNRWCRRIIGPTLAYNLYVEYLGDSQSNQRKMSTSLLSPALHKRSHHYF